MEILMIALTIVTVPILLLGITRLILQLTKPSELLDRELRRRYSKDGRASTKNERKNHE